MKLEEKIEIIGLNNLIRAFNSNDAIQFVQTAKIGGKEILSIDDFPEFELIRISRNEFDEYLTNKKEGSK